MARNKSFLNMSSKDLQTYLVNRQKEEYRSKMEELSELRAKVVVLEQWIRNHRDGNHTRNGFLSVVEPRKQGKNLKESILNFLKKNPAGIKDIVDGTGHKYGSVSQTLVVLKKDKVIKQEGRGTPYQLAK